MTERPSAAELLSAQLVVAHQRIAALERVVAAARAATFMTVTYYDYSEGTDMVVCNDCRVVLWTMRDGETGTPHRDDCKVQALRDALAALDATSDAPDASERRDDGE